MDRDRNTVVKALECSANGAVNCFDSICFYHEPGCACDRSQIMLDALTLLKEQEAVEPKVSCSEQRCGNCNRIIEMDGWKACPWCGKMIDWERWWQKNGTCNQDT